MTKLMEQAIERLKSLPDEEQDQVAGLVLSELDDDRRWAASTERDTHKTQALIDAVIARDEQGLSENLDPEKL
jgi:hypothetical protein